MNLTGPALRATIRSMRHRIRSWMGKDVFVPIQKQRTTERHGSELGGWAVVPDALGPESLIYSFGVGDDVSFDLSLIARYGLTVHAFDPTPRSKEWIGAQTLPPRFVFHDVGISDRDGTLTLFPPDVASHVSFAVVDRTPRTQTAGVQVPVQRLSSIMRALGHTRIDLLKMDIEGSEYDVLPTLGEDGMFPTQVLVEFHHRFFPDGIQRTRSAVRLLNSHGYRLVAVSPTGEELTFLRGA